MLARVLAVSLPLSITAACSNVLSLPTAPESLGESTRVVAPGLEIIRSGPPSGAVEITDLFPAPGQTSAWRLLGAHGDADAVPALKIVRGEETDRFGASRLVDEGGERTLFLAIADSASAPEGGTAPRAGDLVMPATISLTDSALSRFEPALLMGRPQLNASASVEGTSRMTVLTLDEPPKERDRGSATRRISFTADETIRTEMGELRCQRIEIDFHASLRFAEANVKMTIWILPGTGPVAQERREKIVVLGILPRSSSHVLVRVPATGDRRGNS